MKFSSMGGIYRILCSLCFMVLFIACSENENFVKGTQYEKFDKVLYEKTITLRETLQDVLLQYGISDEMLEPYKSVLTILYGLDIKYKVYAVTYHTITPQGNQIKASGVIYYPLTSKPKGVIEISPVNKSKGTCGTERCTMAEVLPGMIGYICLVPDLIGCGSTAELPISYLQHENIATVSADLRCAAEEFICSVLHHELSKESILFGYSLGGSGVMSLARYYAQNPSLGVKVNHIFAGGGAYNPMEVVKAQLAFSRSDYAIIPNILYSLNYYDQLNLDFSKVFKGELLENYQTWCDGYMPIADLTKKLGNDVTNYLSEGLIDSVQTADEFKPLMKALEEKCVPHDWKPEAKIHLFHSKYDYYVPTVCGNEMYAYLKKVGADVTYKLYEAEHVESGLLMEIDFIKFLLKDF